MRVRLYVKVSENALPADFTVRDFSGRLILYRRICRRRNAICFDTCARNLIIAVRPLNAAYTENSQFLKFGCEPCYALRLAFDFPQPVSAAMQEFYLIDENYLFPVAKAMLNFLGGNPPTR